MKEFFCIMKRLVGRNPPLTVCVLQIMHAKSFRRKLNDRDSFVR